MGKVALAFKKSDIFSLVPVLNEVFGPEAVDREKSVVFGIPSEVHGLEARLLSRPECEIDEEFVQLIPYVTLLDISQSKMFIYTRGDAGNEGRLHGKCSLGIGGHIEEAFTPDRGFIDVVTDGLLRELEEEVGLAYSDEDKAIVRQGVSEQLSGIYSEADAVGKVHLGLSLILNVDQSSLGNHEDGVITKGTWMTMGEIVDGLRNNEFELEAWSISVLDAIYNSIVQANQVQNQQQETAVE